LPIRSGIEPGGTITLALTDGQESALIQAGHLVRAENGPKPEEEEGVISDG